MRRYSLRKRYFIFFPLLFNLASPVGAERTIQKRYPIVAEQLSDAIKILNNKRPFTKAHFTFDYAFEKKGKEIKVVRPGINLVNEIWLPLWTPPSEAARIGWESVLTPLVEHEKKHSQLNDKAARKLEKEAIGLSFPSEGANYKELHRRVKTWFRKRISQIQNNHQRIDLHSQNLNP